MFLGARSALHGIFNLMTIENPFLVNILVWIVAGLILVQTALLVLTNFMVRQKIRNIDQSLHSFSQQSVKGMKMIHRGIDVVEEVLPRLPAVQETIERNVDAVIQATQTVSRAMSRGVDLARYQAAETENGVDNLLSILSQQIYKAHEAVSHPSLRLATIIRTGFDVLKRTVLQPDQSPASHPPDDEEKFV